MRVSPTHCRPDRGDDFANLLGVLLAYAPNFHMVAQILIEVFWLKGHGHAVSLNDELAIVIFSERIDKCFGDDARAERTFQAVICGGRSLAEPSW